MKGTIINCVQDLICEKFGKGKWTAVMEKTGLKADQRFMYSSDVDDGTVLSVVGAICSTMNLTLEQVADAFGEYWMNEYSHRFYRSYFSQISNIRDFLNFLNELHSHVTDDIPNAHPPRFEVTKIEDDLFKIRYISARGLIDFVAGLVRGMGRYFKVKVEVKKLSDEEIEARIYDK